MNFPVWRLFALVALFLGVQVAALVHGVSHLPEADASDEPPCVQCLAFAPLGAALVYAPPVARPPVATFFLAIALPVAGSSPFFRRYQSRAPPGG